MDPKTPKPGASPSPEDLEAKGAEEAEEPFFMDPEEASALPIPAPVELDELEDPEDLDSLDPTLPGVGLSDDAEGQLDSQLEHIFVDPDDERIETIDDPRIPADQNFFKIGEVARIVGVKPYVLRYWEGEFSCIKPEKTSSRQRRYRREDVALLLQIRRLRYDEQLTIARTRQLVQQGLELGVPVRVRPTTFPRRSAHPGPSGPSNPSNRPNVQISGISGMYGVSSRYDSGVLDRGHLLRRLQDMRTAVLELIKAVED